MMNNEEHKAKTTKVYLWGDDKATKQAFFKLLTGTQTNPRDSYIFAQCITNKNCTIYLPDQEEKDTNKDNSKNDNTVNIHFPGQNENPVNNSLTWTTRINPQSKEWKSPSVAGAEILSSPLTDLPEDKKSETRNIILDIIASCSRNSLRSDSNESTEKAAIPHTHSNHSKMVGAAGCVGLGTTTLLFNLLVKTGQLSVTALGAKAVPLFILSLLGGPYGFAIAGGLLLAAAGIAFYAKKTETASFNPPPMAYINNDRM